MASLLPDQQKALSIDWDSQKNFEFDYEIGMVDDFNYELSSKVKVKSYPIEVDAKIIDETIADLKKRFGKVSYPDVSEAADNLFGELHSAIRILNASMLSSRLKSREKEQKKFIGLKKEEQVEFDIRKMFSDDAHTAQLLGISPRKRRTQKENIFLRSRTSAVRNQLSRIRSFSIVYLEKIQ